MLFRAIPRPGRPTSVPRETLATLPSLLARGALDYGFSTDLWTIRASSRSPRASGAFATPRRRCGPLLKRHGLSWQRPRRQAREKDLRAVKKSAAALLATV